MLPTGDVDGVRAILDQAEQDLADRMASIRGLDISPRELSAFAAERGRLDEQWDELAVAEDVAADARDNQAVHRDELATDRDRDPRPGIGGDDPGFADRFLSAGNRDDAASDRLAARDDRRHAQAGRQRAALTRHRAAGRDADDAAVQDGGLHALQRALSSRTRMGEATGLLMERYSLDADRAFRMLVYLAQETKVSVEEIAERVVASGELRHAREERNLQPDEVDVRGALLESADRHPGEAAP